MWLHATYKNMAPSGVGWEFLFVSFALAITGKAIIARQGLPRSLIVIEDYSTIQKHFSDKSYLTLFGLGSRSSSPRRG
ncbi:hypothetical protein BDV35DRAFT_333830 [Aspergillus flavus]|uniref:Uncharacterized protein n=1 Tax=Aspergillus flavus TaxID=5059 RepID=A0A5N6HGM6_ASPFL|nr:hypothetical protein BDV35DRAFT_333830 [Aspergillus flavus]